MMAKLKIIYTVEVTREVDIDDETLTRDEIQSAVHKILGDVIPENIQGSDWQWEERPIPKGSTSSPPPDWYQNTPFGRAATNGHCILFERSPIAAKTEPDWIDPEAPPINIGKSISIEFQTLPLHYGLFSKDFSKFARIEGLEVRGEGPESLGYLILNGELVACLMPVKVRRSVTGKSRSVFRFNKINRKQK
jgi:hypothetical protein